MSTELFNSISPAIAAGLVTLAEKLDSVSKNSVNPAFKSKYASLDAILASVKPSLADCGLAVSFGTIPQDDLSNVVVEVLLIHKSGATHSRLFAAPTQKKDAQGVGACITYLKRYGISAILALETDNDDDGNAASGIPPARAPQGATYASATPPPSPRPAPTVAANTGSGRLDVI